MLMPFRQRLYRAQSRDRHRAFADDLPGIGTVRYLHGPPRRPRQRRVRQVSDLQFGSAMSIVMVLIYTHLGAVTLTVAIAVNVLMFVGIFSRMIPSQALISAIPAAQQRGSFSAISASLQQLSGGLGSVFAAAIIAQNADGSLGHFDRLGYVVVAPRWLPCLRCISCRNRLRRDRQGRRLRCIPRTRIWHGAG